MSTTPSQLSGRPISTRFALLAGLLVCVLTFASNAWPQTIELKVKQAFADDGTLSVEGTVKCANLYPSGQHEVINEIVVSLEWIAAGGRFRKLPDMQRILPFALLKSGLVLSDEEIHGIHAERADLWSHVTSPQDERKKLSFEGVGHIENGAQYRLVAELKHSWRGTWPAVIYRQAVIGPQPVPGAQTGEMPQVIPAPEKWTEEQLETTSARIAEWIQSAVLAGKAPGAKLADDLPDSLVDEKFEEYMPRLAKASDDRYVEISQQRTMEMTAALRSALGDVYSKNLSIEQMRSAYASKLDDTQLQYAARMQILAATMKSYHDAQQAIAATEQ